MKLTSKTRLQAHLQNQFFRILFFSIIGLLAWLSTRYQFQADWTLNNRHTLSKESRKLLDKLSGPITITAYASQNEELRRPIQELVGRYQRHKPEITLRFVDPFTVPGEVRERQIQADGELIIDYQKRTEHLRQLSEAEMTMVLQRVARTDKRKIAFLQGHGERNPKGLANQDLNKWSEELTKTGFEVSPLSLGLESSIQANVLVIASPQTQLLPGEINLISEYVDKGGNLLWLLDPPGDLHGLEPLAHQLGLVIQHGLVMDPVSRLFGVKNPSIVSVTTEGYGQHPVTIGLEEYLTLFPQTLGIKIEPPANKWKDTILLKTLPQAWLETDDKVLNPTAEPNQVVEYNEGKDLAGPVTLMVALEHEEVTEAKRRPQRIIIAGDSDFLTNALLQYGGNLQLSMKMLNWLAVDDTFIDIPTKVATDLKLNLSNQAILGLGSFFLLVLPMSLISTGIFVWLRRRKA